MSTVDVVGKNEVSDTFPDALLSAVVQPDLY